MANSKIRDLANAHAEAFRKAFGAESVDAVREVEILSAAESLAIAQFLRGRMVDEGVDLSSAVERAEEVARDKVIALRLPRKPVKPVAPLTVHFVDSFDVKLKQYLRELQPDIAESVVIAELSGRITELQAELKQARTAAESAGSESKRLRAQIAPAVELTRSGSQGGASHPQSNVPMKPQAQPKPEHADAYATLAALNAGFRSSPYIPVDPGDTRDYGPRK